MTNNEKEKPTPTRTDNFWRLVSKTRNGILCTSEWLWFIVCIIHLFAFALRLYSIKHAPKVYLGGAVVCGIFFVLMFGLGLSLGQNTLGIWAFTLSGAAFAFCLSFISQYCAKEEANLLFDFSVLGTLAAIVYSFWLIGGFNFASYAVAADSNNQAFTQLADKQCNATIHLLNQADYPAHQLYSLASQQCVDKLAGTISDVQAQQLFNALSARLKAEPATEK